VPEVIHISDTHFCPDRGHAIRGANPFHRAEALVEAINSLPFTPDFIVHTGDVANDPDRAAYALAAAVFASIRVPIYFATGNHDDVSMMREALTFGPHEPLVEDAEGRLCYRIAGLAGDRVEFFVMDGKVPPAEGPHGHLSDTQIAAVLDRITGTKPVAVFLHFPLTPIGSRWIDDHLLVRNGLEFHRSLATKAGSQLRGIFTGHLHRGLSLYRDGVLQSGVSSPVCEFSAAPDDASCDFLESAALPFHHLSFTEEATMVKMYSLPVRGEP